MSLEDNISNIYDKAVNSQKGKVWESIRDLRTQAAEEIRKNTEAAGADKDVVAALNSIKKANPSLSSEEADKQAINSVIDKRAKEQFVSEIKNESTKGFGMSSLANIGGLVSKFLTLWDGNLKEKFEVLQSNFFQDLKSIGAAFKEARSSNSGKGIIDIFAEHARNANLTNKLGITDENEKKEFLAALASPVASPQQPPSAVADNSGKAQEEAKPVKMRMSNKIKGGEDTSLPQSPPSAQAGAANMAQSAGRS